MFFFSGNIKNFPSFQPIPPSILKRSKAMAVSWSCGGSPALPVGGLVRIVHTHGMKYATSVLSTYPQCCIKEPRKLIYIFLFVCNFFLFLQKQSDNIILAKTRKDQADFYFHTVILCLYITEQQGPKEQQIWSSYSHVIS